MFAKVNMSKTHKRTVFNQNTKKFYQTVELFCHKIYLRFLNINSKLMRRLSFCITFFFFTCFGFSQAETKYTFTQLSIAEGLSQSSVICILQDTKGFMWFGTKDGLNRYDGRYFRTFRHDKNNPNSIGNNTINALYEDKMGLIWVLTDAGIYIYNPEMESFSFFNKVSTDGLIITQPVYQIEIDKQSNIWFSVESQGLFCFKPKEDQLSHYPIVIDKRLYNLTTFSIDQENTIWLGVKGKGLFYVDNFQFSDIKPFTLKNKPADYYTHDDIQRLLPEDKNQIYVGSAKGGLKRIDILNKNIINILPASNSTEDIHVRNITRYLEDILLISTENGIYIYNKKTDNSIQLKHNPFDPYSLSDNAIYNIYKDREGSLWIGSYFGGISYCNPHNTNFEKYYPTNDPNNLQGRIVREFCEDNEGNLWIGTEDAGLNKFNPKTKTFIHYKHPNLYHNIHALCLDNNTLWIGTFSRGLCRLNLKSNNLKQYLCTTQKHSINDNSIFSMYKTSSGDLYIGTPLGANKYNREKDNFDSIRELEGIFIFDIYEDSNGHLWFASYTNGIFQFNPRKNTWKNYTTNNSTIPCNKAISIFEDSQNQLWFTFQGGGFSKFNPHSETFTTFDSSSGLPNDVVYQIIEDKNGSFWLTTNKGLVQFCPHEQTYKTYTSTNGLLTDQFNYSSGIKTTNGTIYFGSINGFISFLPEVFTENNTFPDIIITDFRLFNQKVDIGNHSPLSKSISYTDHLTLNYKQNSFAFQFTSLNYASLSDKLSYKLEGFDKDWYNVTKEPIATYTNLKPGKYTFKVRSANNAGAWNKHSKSISIEIRPPFWETNIAYVIYLICGGILATFILFRFKKKMAQKQQRNIERLNVEKEKELYQAKFDFFNNIAHEIRTPLSLIKAPLENILRKNDFGIDTKEDLDIMEKNTLRLLELTNQLLDFKKAETQGFSLHFINCNISALIRDIHLRFNPTAKKQGIHFDSILPEDDFYAPVDKEILTKILSNLFSNAIKYTDDYITVELLPGSPNDGTHKFAIKVSNNGERIPDEQKENIFKPFVRIKHNHENKDMGGTGIGLPLARSLAELHSGTLTLLNNDETVCFMLELPLTQKNQFGILKEYEKEATELPKKHNVAQSNYTLLIVEDNPDMLSFLTKQLERTYHILQASNGAEALNKLKKNAVDLIISDIMMPVMDGLDLCHNIKSDIAYSHIPFILLTAKTNLQSKIKGIETGADDYIEKPFSTGYLLAKISTLLSTQEIRRQAFSKSPFIKANSVALNKADEKFLEQLTNIIQKNLSEPTFNVDILAANMNMSRSSLHRKTKGLLDLTPNEFIQVERLKKSAELLRTKEYKINEICYITGFNSSSYFAKCFQKQFGVLPKDFH